MCNLVKCNWLSYFDNASCSQTNTRPGGDFVQAGMLFGNFQLRTIYVNVKYFIQRLETWSRSRDPCLQVSVSMVSGLVSGLVSVSKATGPETVKIAKKWLSKISVIQRFLFIAFVGKKQPKQAEKSQKFDKTSTQKR